jgi:low affinity Fe/Cu permease
MADLFARWANRAAALTGHYLTFLAAVSIVLIWAVSGPFFGFSETWQLVINTGTTIVTFLMVFLIQNTQNRDALAVHLKLDELIRAIEEADNELMHAEDETDQELADLKAKYLHLCEEHDALKQRVGEQAPSPAAS